MDVSGELTLVTIRLVGDGEFISCQKDYRMGTNLYFYGHFG